MAVFFLLFSTTVSADELPDFNQVKSAVLAGKSIRIAVHFPQCSGQANLAPIPVQNVGTFTPNEVAIDKSGNIAASLTHFTLNNPDFLDKPVYEFVTYKILDANTVKLTIQVLDATNYQPLTSKFYFDCELRKGAKIYS